MDDLFLIVIESLRLGFSIFECIRLIDDEKSAIRILRDTQAELSQALKRGRLIRCRKVKRLEVLPWDLAALCEFQPRSKVSGGIRKEVVAIRDENDKHSLPHEETGKGGE